MDILQQRIGCICAIFLLSCPPALHAAEAVDARANALRSIGLADTPSALAAAILGLIDANYDNKAKICDMARILNDTDVVMRLEGDEGAAKGTSPLEKILLHVSGHMEGASELLEALCTSETYGKLSGKQGYYMRSLVLIDAIGHLKEPSERLFAILIDLAVSETGLDSSAHRALFMIGNDNALKKLWSMLAKMPNKMRFSHFEAQFFRTTPAVFHYLATSALHKRDDDIAMRIILSKDSAISPFSDPPIRLPTYEDAPKAARQAILEDLSNLMDTLGPSLTASQRDRVKEIKEILAKKEGEPRTAEQEGSREKPTVKEPTITPQQLIDIGFNETQRNVFSRKGILLGHLRKLIGFDPKNFARIPGRRDDGFRQLYINGIRCIIKAVDASAQTPIANGVDMETNAQSSHGAEQRGANIMLNDDTLVDVMVALMSEEDRIRRSEKEEQAAEAIRKTSANPPEEENINRQNAADKASGVNQ